MPAEMPALHPARPDASPHEARRAYEAFMAVYAPELPAVWDALPARMQRAWGAVVDAVRADDQGQDTRAEDDA